MGLAQIVRAFLSQQIYLEGDFNLVFKLMNFFHIKNLIFLNQLPILKIVLSLE